MKKLSSENSYTGPKIRCDAVSALCRQWDHQFWGLMWDKGLMNVVRRVENGEKVQWAFMDNLPTEKRRELLKIYEEGFDAITREKLESFGL